MKPNSPRDPSSPAELGAHALAGGHYETALAFFIQAHRQEPENAGVQKGTGICLHHLERYPEAAEFYIEALRSRPHDAELWANLGHVEASLGNLDIACQYLEKAVELNPEQADIRYNHGNVCLAANLFEVAREAFSHAVLIAPRHYEALIGLGLVYKQENKVDAAADCYRQAMAVAPKRPEAYVNLANLFYEDDAHGAAERVLREGISHSTPNEALYYNLGNVLKAKEAYSEALNAFQGAIQICPTHARSHWNKALTHLALGQYKDGWREYEWRQKKQDWSDYYPHQHSTPVWRGEDIGDKVLLVHDEQGYGDTIQFCRYLSMARKYCSKLVFETRRSLLPLFKDMGPIDHLIERSAAPNRRTIWDLHVPLLSLPHLLGTGVDSIPNATPYLSPDPSRVAHFLDEMDRCRINIGLVWAGNPSHHNDRNRSMSLTQLTPLFNLPKVAWHSLQIGAAAKETAKLPVGFSIHQWADSLNSFADTAALVWALDLVISVDTAVAHLAGALGKKVWLLLPPHNVDWRWQLDKSTSPWYPTMNVFRQPCDQDETILVKELNSHLIALVDSVSSN
jgi:tetratricopeptide (TPR) repeat protein